MRLLYEIIHYLRPDLLRVLGLPTRRVEKVRRIPIREILHPEELEVTVKHPDNHITFERVGTAYLEKRDTKKEVTEGLARQARNQKAFEEHPELRPPTPVRVRHIEPMSEETAEDYAKILSSKS